MLMKVTVVNKEWEMSRKGSHPDQGIFCENLSKEKIHMKVKEKVLAISVAISLLSGCAAVPPPKPIPQRPTSSTLPPELQNANTVWIPHVIPEKTSGQNNTTYYTPISQHDELYINKRKVRTPAGSDIVGFIPNQKGYLLCVYVPLGSELMREIEMGGYHGRTLTTDIGPHDGASLTYAFYQVNKAGENPKLIFVGKSSNGIIESTNAIYLDNTAQEGIEDVDHLVGVAAKNDSRISGPRGYLQLFPMSGGKWLAIKGTSLPLGVRLHWIILSNRRDGFVEIRRLGFHNSYNENRIYFERLPRPIYVNMPSYSESVIGGAIVYKKRDVMLNGGSDNSSGAAYIYDLPGIPNSFYPDSVPESTSKKFPYGVSNFPYGYLVADKTPYLVRNDIGIGQALTGLFTLGMAGGNSQIEARNINTGTVVPIANDDQLSDDMVVIPMQTPNNGYIMTLSMSGKPLHDGRTFSLNQDEYISGRVMMNWATEYGIGTGMA